MPHKYHAAKKGQTWSHFEAHLWISARKGSGVRPGLLQTQSGGDSMTKMISRCIIGTHLQRRRPQEDEGTQNECSSTIFVRKVQGLEARIDLFWRTKASFEAGRNKYLFIHRNGGRKRARLTFFPEKFEGGLIVRSITLVSTANAVVLRMVIRSLTTWGTPTSPPPNMYSLTAV